MSGSLQSSLPDFLPARIVNEFVYCPRLAYLEWVQGEWDDNLDVAHRSSRRATYDAAAFGMRRLALDAWVSEAHQRGLELHVWFNPYRAGNLSDTWPLAVNHRARLRPDLARSAQGQLWFDPGEPDVQSHTLAVIVDVLTRYDIDGVHLDDYFYPYPVSGAPLPIQFPDDSSYAKYLATGGAGMPRADW